MSQEDKWIGSWYDQADRLQAIESFHGLDDNDLRFNMPTIICLGEESSGKSSTMERLASFKFFPTDRKLCTRLPVKLCIRYCPEEQLEEDFRERGKVMMKLTRLERRMQQIIRELGGSDEMKTDVQGRKRRLSEPQPSHMSI